MVFNEHVSEKLLPLSDRVPFMRGFNDCIMTLLMVNNSFTFALHILKSSLVVRNLMCVFMQTPPMVLLTVNKAFTKIIRLAH